MFLFTFLKPVLCISHNYFTGSKCFNNEDRLNIKMPLSSVWSKLSRVRLAHVTKEPSVYNSMAQSFKDRKNKGTACIKVEPGYQWLTRKSFDSKSAVCFALLVFLQQ